MLAEIQASMFTEAKIAKLINRTMDHLFLGEIFKQQFLQHRGYRNKMAHASVVPIGHLLKSPLSSPITLSPCYREAT